MRRPRAWSQWEAAPRPYLDAAALLGCDPADAVVFEDADAGIRSGLAAGMQVVVVGDAAGPIAEGLPAIRDYSQIEASVDGDIITLTLD